MDLLSREEWDRVNRREQNRGEETGEEQKWTKEVSRRGVDVRAVPCEAVVGSNFSVVEMPSLEL